MRKNLNKVNWGVRIFAFLFVVISIALFYPEFYQQFNCYLKGKANIISQEWHIAALNILLFLLLLLPLSFRKKARWGEYGLVTAFFVSLFIEMYGFPLTIYFASRYFSEPVACLPPVLSFDFWGVSFGMELPMIFSMIFIFIGTLLIVWGWITLYRKSKKNDFVVSGIYKYSRHPQYLGFCMIVFGWFIDWPTLITVIFAPLLIYKYVKVCVVEEREILKEHPEYGKYIERVPFFI
ncbi:MAG: Isoprenylcysteine carboxyl methyltransferase [Candidatus Peregrinibacteria bacterium GW2011_GWA2_33_10]|nr:MAG: Isoprenylcysteine carboxyl methyltransferase [Candidatus Peregrinibacteria bacterium GW2011_GWA2_33_10]KKP40908.1 MAG: hypothetical protein UR30_C0003G0080 [Candidatus Peregrinibacteria bacterium GW2011_GWC2_33_13]OGJ50151.1 MAG: hypothetical protein A2229_00290 [Candidatus Peregrinibacteria bacterium RIFOXYA2_FULL_33_7]